MRKLWNDVNIAFAVASMYVMANPKIVAVVAGVVIAVAVAVACC
jgi:hypothetical protein